MKAYALTTYDNPYDPIEDTAKWQAFDVSHGYHTAERLAKLSSSSSSLMPAEDSRSTKYAIDIMIRLFGSDVYKVLVFEE